jgi:hypothetical protein
MRLELIDSPKALRLPSRRPLQLLSSTPFEPELAIATIFGAHSNCIMAGTLAAAKKEMRKKIRDILQNLPEAAAASQSML